VAIRATRGVAHNDNPACHPGFSGELILLSVIDAGSLWARRLIDGMVEREAAVIGQLQEGVKR